MSVVKVQCYEKNEGGSVLYNIYIPRIVAQEAGFEKGCAVDVTCVAPGVIEARMLRPV